MDKMIFTAAQGANRIMQAQTIRANNLANADTPGFRADLERVEAKYIETVPMAFNTRVLANEVQNGYSNRYGVPNATGRPLDIAIRGEGFIAVEVGEDGIEGYTRNGSMELNAEGQLTIDGFTVAGAGGPLVLPAYRDIFISDTGVISVLPEAGGIMQQVGQLKLVMPEEGTIEKGKNGLFYAAEGEPLEADALVRVQSGALESSNVEAVSELISMLELSRQFEMQLKMMKSADKLAETGNSLLRNA